MDMVCVRRARCPPECLPPWTSVQWNREVKVSWSSPQRPTPRFHPPWSLPRCPPVQSLANEPEYEQIYSVFPDPNRLKPVPAAGNLLLPEIHTLYWSRFTAHPQHIVLVRAPPAGNFLHYWLSVWGRNKSGVFLLIVTSVPSEQHVTSCSWLVY